VGEGEEDDVGGEAAVAGAAEGAAGGACGCGHFVGLFVRFLVVWLRFGEERQRVGRWSRALYLVVRGVSLLMFGAERAQLSGLFPLTKLLYSSQ